MATKKKACRACRPSAPETTGPLHFGEASTEVAAAAQKAGSMFDAVAETFRAFTEILQAAKALIPK